MVFLRWSATTTGTSTHETLEEAFAAEAAKAAELADDRPFTLTVEDQTVVYHWTKVG